MTIRTNMTPKVILQTHQNPFATLSHYIIQLSLLNNQDLLITPYIQLIKEIMEIFLESGQNYAFLLQLIVHYLKLDQRKKVNLVYLSPGALLAAKSKKLGIEIPSLVTPEGHVETQIFQICKRLFAILPQWRSFFLGEGDEAAEIAGVKTHLKEGKQLRKHLQKHLESRTFFVGSHLSFADFFMFTHLYDNLLDLTDEQKLQYNNLFRWYKHIQNLPQVHAFLSGTKRFLIQDPAPKYPFLAEKKKPKKDKKQDEPLKDKQDKKQEDRKQEDKKAETHEDKKEEAVTAKVEAVAAKVEEAENKQAVAVQEKTE